MEFKITVINTESGEPETKIINEKNCWKMLSGAYVRGTHGKIIKPVNLKLELIPKK